MARSIESITRQAEELLGRAGDSLPRVSEELPAFAGLLRSEPRLRAALTDIAVGTEAKRTLLQKLLGDRADPGTLEVIGLLVEQNLSAQDLERAAADLAVRGLLAKAEADGSLEEVEDELFRFARVIDGEPGLRSALMDPALPREVATALVRDLLESKAHPETVALVEFELAFRTERDPANALTELAELAAARRGRVVVEARTAVPIDVQRRTRLEEALARTVGRRVDLEVVVDPDVVGGVVARVGDEVIDGSVKRKLERALEELTT